jgi:hypothetical protein
MSKTTRKHTRHVKLPRSDIAVAAFEAVAIVEYCLDPSDKAAIREDIRSYVINGIHDAPVKTVQVR